MTRALTTASLFLLTAAPALWSCSDDGQPAVDMNHAAVDMNNWDHAPGAEAGIADKGPGADLQPADAGPPDASPIKVINETEPNNGGTKTEYNSITAPIQIKGVIGTAEDADIFGLSAPAGARYSVTVKGDGTLQPHVVIFDLDNKLPVAASNGATTALAEYYTLQAANPLLIVVRDRRNLAKPSQKVGGAAFTYTVTVTPLTRAPVQVAVGAQQTSTLAPQGMVRVFAFTAAKDAELDLEALVTAPADIDARLSLFHVGNKSWHGTNETPGALDAKLTGKMPFSGTFHAIVENVADYPTKLDFTFKITKK